MAQLHIVRLSLIFLLLILLTLGLSAQVSGVAGKKFILKTNLASHLTLSGVNAQAEYVVFRRQSIQFEYENGPIRQSLEITLGQIIPFLIGILLG